MAAFGIRTMLVSHQTQLFATVHNTPLTLANERTMKSGPRDGISNVKVSEIRALRDGHMPGTRQTPFVKRD
jgi:hypothetical protein